MALDTGILFNVPNLLGFARLFMIILMAVQVRKRPIMSFALCWGSGLIDMVDGRIARFLNETSKFGAFADHFVDRLTTQTQMYALASLFPRYAMLFMAVSYIELGRDLAVYKRDVFLMELNLVPSMVSSYSRLKSLEFYSFFF